MTEFRNKRIASELLMNNTMIINILNSDNSIIINIKTQNHQIMTTITDIISKLELAKQNYKTYIF